MVNKDKSMYWSLQSLDSIGGMVPVLKGSPEVANLENTKAIQFSGLGDGLFFQENPLKGLEEFTVELRFRPEKGGLPEQRFLHFGYPTRDRVLFETRLTESGDWFLDTFIASGKSESTLFNNGFLHSTDRWYHLALSCDGSEHINYVDGVEEQRGAIMFQAMKGGEMSIGVRLNQICWFKGALAQLSITSKSLKPTEFLLI